MSEQKAPFDPCFHQCVCMGYAQRSEMLKDLPCTKENCKHRPMSEYEYDAWMKEHDRAIREATMDEFGILHGEAAKRLHDYMNAAPSKESPASDPCDRTIPECDKCKGGEE